MAENLAYLPDGTILDGEMAALDPHGRPRFNLMQNRRSSRAHIVYFVFNILMHQDKDLNKAPSIKAPRAVAYSGNVTVSERTSSAENLLRFVHEHQLEGIVAKQADSIYQPGKRSGS